MHMLLTNSRESNSYWCLLADGIKHLRLAILGDVVCHFKIAKCPYVMNNDEICSITQIVHV